MIFITFPKMSVVEIGLGFGLFESVEDNQYLLYNYYTSGIMLADGQNIGIQDMIPAIGVFVITLSNRLSLI